MLAIDHSNENNHFTLIRIGCAFLVFLEHSFYVFDKAFTFDPCRFLFSYSSGSVGVAVFFCMSGYLVSSSYFSSSKLIHYLIKRVLRILPALVVLILLSVFLLYFISELPFLTYLTDQRTGLYVQNCFIFRINYHLPNVFESNHHSAVNSSLWSIPYEFFCYLLLPLIYSLNIRKFKLIYLCFSILLVILYQVDLQQLESLTIPILGINLKSFFLPFLYFNCGMLFFLFQKNIQFKRYELLLMALILIAVSVDLLPKIFNLLTIAYLTFYLAFLKPEKSHFSRRIPDLSYGFYLYAFPVQQLYVHFFAGQWNFLSFFFTALPSTLLIAYLSWILIEKPALSLKRKLLI